MISTNIQQYLKVIDQRDEAGEPVTSSAIAARLHYSVPSVTNRVKQPAAESGVIRRVNDDSAERPRDLSKLGVRLNQTFTIVARAPFKGPIRLRMGEKELSVGAEFAHEIFVAALETGNEG